MIPIGYATLSCPRSINVGTARRCSMSSQITGRRLWAGLWAALTGPLVCCLWVFTALLNSSFTTKGDKLTCACQVSAASLLGWDFPLAVFSFLLWVKKLKQFSLKVSSRKKKSLFNLPFAPFECTALCTSHGGAGGIQCFYLENRLRALRFHLERCNFTPDQNKTLKTLSSTANSPLSYF